MTVSDAENTPAVPCTAVVEKSHTSWSVPTAPGGRSTRGTTASLRGSSVAVRDV